MPGSNTAPPPKRASSAISHFIPATTRPTSRKAINEVEDIEYSPFFRGKTFLTKMAYNFAKELAPYNLVTEFHKDRWASTVFVNVGRDKNGLQSPSLKFLSRQVSEYIATEAELLDRATRLYVVGKWVTSEAAEDVVIQDEVEASRRTMRNGRSISLEEEEWHQGVAIICELIEKMEALEELTWMSTLPFSEEVWAVLAPQLTKLVLDIGQAVELDASDDNRPSYIKPEAMRPLINFTVLEELRIYGMRDSYQSTIWETVYRNDSIAGPMRVLDLKMAAPPLVRQKDWDNATHSLGLQAPVDVECEYKGNEGKGTLHHQFGTGEYLDELCMRKARLAAGLDEAKPLPLCCLKLDGFVLDHLPFVSELSDIVLLTVGATCIDTGLRPPKTEHPINNWKGIKPNCEETHCLIQFPYWKAVFDAEGELKAKWTKD